MENNFSRKNVQDIRNVCKDFLDSIFYFFFTVTFAVIFPSLASQPSAE